MKNHFSCPQKFAMQVPNAKHVIGETHPCAGGRALTGQHGQRVSLELRRSKLPAGADCDDPIRGFCPVSVTAPTPRRHCPTS